MRSHQAFSSVRALVALPFLVLLPSCSLLLQPDPPPRLPPDSGPPVGGHDVTDWDGDAAVDPGDASDDDGGLSDSGAIDASEPDAGEPDAGEPDAGVPDAGEPDAGVPQDVACGTISNLADDFGSPPVDWVLESVGGAHVWHADSGYIRFELPEGSTPESGHGRLVGRWVTSLRGDLLRLDFGRLAPWLITSLTLVGPDDANEALRIHHHEGTYVASLVSTQDGVDLSGEQLLLEAHPHWRIRHSEDDQVRFEVSTDGSAWVELLAAPGPSWIDHVRPILRVHGENTTQADLVVLDEVQGRSLSPSWCSLGALSEPFDAPLSPAWEPLDGQSCSGTLNAGALVLTQSASATRDCALRLSAPRALEGQTLVMKLTEWPAASLTDTFAGLRMILDDSHELSFGMRGGSLHAQLQALDGSDSHSGPSVEVAVAGPLYLRLVVLWGGVARFSYGVEGVGYTQLWERALPTSDEALLTLTLDPLSASEPITAGAVLRIEGLNAE